MGGLANKSPQTLEEQPWTQQYSDYSLYILPYTGYFIQGNCNFRDNKQKGLRQEKG